MLKFLFGLLVSVLSSFGVVYLFGGNNIVSKGSVYEPKSRFVTKKRREKLFIAVEEASSKGIGISDLSRRVVGVSKRTIRRDMDWLEGKGLVVQTGLTKDAIYKILKK